MSANIRKKKRVKKNLCRTWFHHDLTEIIFKINHFLGSNIQVNCSQNNSKWLPLYLSFSLLYLIRWRKIFQTSSTFLPPAMATSSGWVRCALLGNSSLLSAQLSNLNSTRITLLPSKQSITLTIVFSLRTKLTRRVSTPKLAKVQPLKISSMMRSRRNFPTSLSLP